MPLTRVLIVEDHPLFTKGLVSLIISQPLYIIAGEAKNFAEAMELVKTKNPNLVIVDLNLGDEDGLDVIKAIKAEYPDMVVLVLSMHDERHYAGRALKMGAQGYIMKEEAGNKVLDAIKTVMSGGIYLSEAEQERLLGKNPAGADQEKVQVPIRDLSNRQFQIFSFIGKGLGTAEIAAKLNLSVKTIDAHKAHLKTKLRCNSSLELRQLAIEWSNS
jgi:DNA-binding NarL/FixJ family response regulator